MPDFRIRKDGVFACEAQPMPEWFACFGEMGFSNNEAGLTSEEAASRLARRRKRERRFPRFPGWIGIFIRQFRSPFIALLLGAMVLSFALGDRAEALVVSAILLMGTVLGFWQEFRATRAVEALAERIGIRCAVSRDGRVREIPRDEVVEGDVVILKAGDAIPGDGVLLEAKDLHVDESALTGESFPVEKYAPAPGAAIFPENEIHAGTHVAGGTAKMLVSRVGEQTETGAIAGRLRLRKPETDFERGLRRLGDTLLRTTFVFVVVVFVANAVLGRPVVESMLFTLALAVGMAPELLPAIVTITLARGARTLAVDHVIVKRPASIESFGGMTVLCADKTGTLTEGKMRLAAAVDSCGTDSARVLLLAAMNSRFESGFSNPIDAALSGLCEEELRGWRKLDEVPYGFLRRRLSILARPADSEAPALMVTKGAVPNVFEVCSSVKMPNVRMDMGAARRELMEVFSKLASGGNRVIAVATREISEERPIGHDDERNMVFEGFVAFEDAPKTDAGSLVTELAGLGVDFKVITGDHRQVAEHLLRKLGISHPRVLTGERIRRMKEDALVRRAAQTHVFAEMEPDQKERVILALRRGGAVVGFLGDGINDAPSLHAADVAISVDGAVDVAKEAADIVLMRHGLDVVAKGIRNGRAVMANTLKYLRITTSANFGNMFSMAVGALFLPFLPLMPRQVLLNNFLSDLPALAISTDAVDVEETSRPLVWDIGRLARFMALFGLTGSVFDILTFVVLFKMPGVGASQFQTLWFAESLLTQVLVILVLRTNGPMNASRAAPLLLWAIAGTTAVALGVLIFGWPGAAGFVPVPSNGISAVLAITALYLLATEILKRFCAGSATIRQEGVGRQTA